MRGHEAIIDMRRRGKKPDTVFINFDDFPQAWRHWPQDGLHTPSVLIEATDNPKRLDLRFAVDLAVVVTGQVHHVVKELVEAVMKHGAQRTIGGVTQHCGGDRFDLVEVFDSAEQGARWHTP